MNELQKIAEIEAQIEAFLRKYECDSGGLDDLQITPSPCKRLKKSKNADAGGQKGADAGLNDLELVVSIYRLLSYDFFYYSKKWNYSALVRIMNEHGSSATTGAGDHIGPANRAFFKWMVVKTMTKLLMMTSNQQHYVFGLYFSQTDQKKFEIMFHQIFLENVQEPERISYNFFPIDAGLLKLVHEDLKKPSLDIYLRNISPSLVAELKQCTSVKKTKNLVNNFFASFDGIFLPKQIGRSVSTDSADSDKYNLVFVESARFNLNRLAGAILTDLSVFVRGEASSGKTALVEYLAFKTGNKLVKFQMDEFMDSKALTGNYTCSNMPGEFFWKPGPLYQAVAEDSWLLLEDIDHAPIDSLSLIINLLETKSINTSENTINIKQNFRLFQTMRVEKSAARGANQAYLDTIEKLSRPIHFRPFSSAEIKKIIENLNSLQASRSAEFVQICEKVIYVYKAIGHLTSFAHSSVEETTVLESNGSFFNFLDLLSHFKKHEHHFVKDGRTVTLRDLVKFFQRLKRTSSGPSLNPINILNDINECFLAYLSNKSIRNELMVYIGSLFSLSKQQIESLIIQNKPHFETLTSKLVAGRVKLERKTGGPRGDLELARTNETFVYTTKSLKLLEKVARCIECNEPILLCGETGVGKTTVLQHLAKLLGQKLVVINLNNQTETCDLLGSFKPVDINYHMKALKERFQDIFIRSFSSSDNQTFFEHIKKCYDTQNWSYFLQLISFATKSACTKFQEEAKKSNELLKEWTEFQAFLNFVERNVEKLRKSFTFEFFEGSLTKALTNGEWIILDEINLASSETLQFLASLLEENDSEESSIILYEKGSNEPLKRHPNFRLFAAMNPATDIGKRNLSSNIRNRFTEIYVDDVDDSADLELIIRNYLLPLTHVTSELIKSIASFYLRLKEKDETIMRNLSNSEGFQPNYSLRTLCRALQYASFNFSNNSVISIYDGLCLSFLTDLNRTSIKFLDDYIRDCLFVKAKSQNKVTSLDPKKINRQKPELQKVLNGQSCVGEDWKNWDTVNVEGFWLLKGAQKCLGDEKYIFTHSIRENLKSVARICSARLPCLIQGETSIGKTSLIKWLAHATGNTLIRINNHDHTDIQEYVGSYVLNDVNGEAKFSFREGLLVKAMRNGFWILLDELNLASSEVLEALNRVLDDNRELYIHETQENVKAHPKFMLFATQNPPGKYAGRKQLSKAFRNRFVQLNFEELPDDELQLIVEKKCNLPNSYAKLLIQTVHELKTKRSQTNTIFLGKHSLITLRDLFRWARRYSSNIIDEKLMKDIDWRQFIAEQGLLLLSARCRSQDDIITIHSSIEKVFHRRIDIANLTNPQTFCKPIMHLLDETIAYASEHFKSFVWTPNARRMALLVNLSYRYDEPFLLVGDTGLGKTTICQIVAEMNRKRLHIVNCHMHSEASDFIGSIRPVRQSSDANNQKKADSNEKVFEWQDGPLLEAMKLGEDFLIDEISLADDSVLERLNSLLEDDRTILLTENVGGANSSVVVAREAFRIFATMNPSGDYGKKELSMALRNRFTEIWCPSPNFKFSEQEKSASHAENEFELICRESLLSRSDFDAFDDEFKSIVDRVREICIRAVCSFLKWLQGQQFVLSNRANDRSLLSIRDLINWLRFVNTTSRNYLARLSESLGKRQVRMETGVRDEPRNDDMNPFLSLVHGACLVCIDFMNSAEGDPNAPNPRQVSLKKIVEILKTLVIKEETFQGPLLALKQEMLDFEGSYFAEVVVEDDDNYFACSPFSVKKAPAAPAAGKGRKAVGKEKYVFNSKTTVANLQRIMRCLVMDNPILLEGSPGVGKTSIIEALAHATRNRVIRINLSEQTDLNELFGTDLPQATPQASEDLNDSNNNPKTEEAAKQQRTDQTFKWCDGPFLHALKKGYWIILDEINLASQSVLEGLNSCFDHRGEVFVCELNRRFKINRKRTKIFACQNPSQQGGGRKCLPKSFLNRFFKVYVDQMTSTDLFLILDKLYSSTNELISREHLEKMIKFNECMNEEVCVRKRWGQSGSPWEFNLRDLIRWCELIVKEQSLSSSSRLVSPGDYVYLIYANRFRLPEDKRKCYELFERIFGVKAYMQSDNIEFNIAKTHLQIGHSVLKFQGTNDFLSTATSLASNIFVSHHYPLEADKYALTETSLKYLESIMKCLEMNWMAILVGQSSVGKTSLVRLLASMMKKKLVEFSVNNNTDTCDLLGGFTKFDDLGTKVTELASKVCSIYSHAVNESIEAAASHSDTQKSPKKFEQRLLNLSDFLYKFSHLNEQLSKEKNNPNILDNSNSMSSILQEMVALFESHLASFNGILKANVSSENKVAAEMRSEIQDFKRKFAALKSGGKSNLNFVWKDSQLVTAIEMGHWVLIDNANFCSPAVLDRLNPLLESSENASLELSEKGLESNGKLKRIRAHKNFKLILCMNEKFGELSRPMRNRGIEIYLRELEISTSSIENDVKLMLRSSYIFKRNSQFDYVLNKLLSLNSRSVGALTGKSLASYSVLNKLYKLVYSYWMVETFKKSLGSGSAEAHDLQVLDQSLSNAIAEVFVDFKPDEESADVVMADDESGSSSLVMKNDVFELNEFYAQKYVYKFKVFELFLDYLANYFTGASGTALSALGSTFIEFLNANKMTQFIRVWLMHIPIKHFRSILEFTRLNMEQRLKRRSRPDSFQSADNMFGFVENRLFGSKSGANELCKMLLEKMEQAPAAETDPDLNFDLRDAHQVLKKLIHELSLEVHLDLTEESIDLRYSRSLLVRIEKTIDGSFAGEKSALVNAKLRLVKKLILIIDWLMYIELSSYKTAFIYPGKSAGPSQSGGLDTSSGIKAFDLDELCNEYYRSLSALVINFVLSSEDTEPLNIVGLEDLSTDSKRKADLIKLNIFNLEKFFLLTRSLSGQTGASQIGLVKIIWMFFYESYKDLEAAFKLDFWTVKLKSLVNGLNDRLQYNFRVYQVYFNLWSLYKAARNDLTLAIGSLDSAAPGREDLAGFINKKLAEWNILSKTQQIFLKSKLMAQSQIEPGVLRKLAAYSKHSSTIRAEMSQLVQFFVGYFGQREQDEQIDQGTLISALTKIDALFAEGAEVQEASAEIQIPAVNIDDLNLIIEPLEVYFTMLKYLSNADGTSLSNIKPANLFELVKFSTAGEAQESFATNIGKFHSIFNRMSKKYFNMIEILVNWNAESVEKSSSSLCDSQLSYIHYDWLSEYIGKNLIFGEKKKDNRLSFRELKLKNCFSKLNELKELNTKLWSNFSLVKADSTQAFENSIYELSCQQLAQIRTLFNGNAEFNKYLNGKGLGQNDWSLSNYAQKQSSAEMTVSLGIIQNGVILAYLLTPMDPINPYDFKILVDKNASDLVVLNETELELNARLSRSPARPRQNAQSGPAVDVFSLISQYFDRELSNSSVYAEIKNEFENQMQMLFGGSKLFNMVKRMVEWGQKKAKDAGKELVQLDDEFKVWIRSLESFINKMTNDYFKFYEVIWFPINALSLVGYGLNSLYTKWRVRVQEQQVQGFAHLGRLVSQLVSFPAGVQSFETIDSLFQTTFQYQDSIQSQEDRAAINYELLDELNYLLLLHVYNSQVFGIADSESINRLKDMVDYFSLRIRQQTNDDDNDGRFYKYKSYGQSEIESEIDQIELDAMFPTFRGEFQDFIDENPDEWSKSKKPVPQEPVAAEEETQNEDLRMNKLVRDNIFNLFLLISNQPKLDKPMKLELLVNKFNQSYETGLHIGQKLNMKLDTTSRYPLRVLGHIRYLSSFKYSQSDSLENFVKRSLGAPEIYDIYKDSNYQEVLKCKCLLDNITSRLEALLAEWTENPILLELKKVINRILSFDLNDPLLKYLTGLELLIEKTEKWQLVSEGSEPNSLRPELRKLHELVVQWRAQELNYWHRSLDIEESQFNQEINQNWFFKLYDACMEFLAMEEPDYRGILRTFNMFMSNSTYGEFINRISLLNEIQSLLKLTTSAEDRSSDQNYRILLDMIECIQTYYTSVYNDAVNEFIQRFKSELKVELKDYINIVTWKDMNYWSLKETIHKSQKFIFKLIKKFKSLLRTSIEFEGLFSGLSKINLSEKNPSQYAKLVVRCEGLISDSKAWKEKDDMNMLAERLQDSLVSSQPEYQLSNLKNYFSKSLKHVNRLVKKVLNAKHEIGELTDEFAEYNMSYYTNLSDSVNKLIDKYNTNVRRLTKSKESNPESDISKKIASEKKEFANSFKKEQKYLTTQRKKFLSDLQKELTNAGVSYRRGRIHYLNLLKSLRSANKLFLGRNSAQEVSTHTASDSQEKSNPQDELGLFLVFEPVAASPALPTRELFRSSQDLYYLTMTHFLNFERVLETPGQQKNVVKDKLQIEQLRGFVEHLFVFIYNQKVELNHVLNDVNSLDALYGLIQLAAGSESASLNYDSDNFVLVTELEAFINRALHSIDQTDAFFSNMLAKVKTTDDATSGSDEKSEVLRIKALLSNENINKAYELVKDQSAALRDYLLSNLDALKRFGAATRHEDETSKEHRINLLSQAEKESLLTVRRKFEQNGEFECLLDNLESFCVNGELEQLVEIFGFESIRESFLEMNKTIEDKTNASGVADSTTEEVRAKSLISEANDLEAKVIQQILKSNEKFFKKYLAKKEAAAEEAEEKQVNFFKFEKTALEKEMYIDFLDDIGNMNLANINVSLRSYFATTQELLKTYDVLSKSSPSSSLIGEIREALNRSNLGSFIRVHEHLVTKWVSSLVGTHTKSCKLLSTLVYLFDDLRKNWANLVKDINLDDEQQSSKPSKKKNKKSGQESDEETVTGLGQNMDDQDDVKDVSSKIENEDQLDDTVDPKSEKNEKKDDKDSKKDIKDEKDGIEMTDDFEAELDDPEPEETGENEEGEEDQDDAESLNDLDDQKGKVDGPDDMKDILDKKIWDDDDDEKESENGEAPELDEEQLDDNMGDELKVEDSKEITSKSENKKDKNQTAAPKETEDEHVQNPDEMSDVEAEEEEDGKDDKKESEKKESQENDEKGAEEDDIGELKEDKMDTNEEGEDEAPKDLENEGAVEQEPEGDQGPDDEPKVDEENEAKADYHSSKNDTSKSDQDKENKTKSKANQQSKKEEATVDEDREKDAELQQQVDEEPEKMEVEEQGAEDDTGDLIMNKDQTAQDETKPVNEKKSLANMNRTLADQTSLEDQAEKIDLIDSTENMKSQSKNQDQKKKSNQYQHIDSNEQEHDMVAYDAATESQKQKLEKESKNLTNKEREDDSLELENESKKKLPNKNQDKTAPEDLELNKNYREHQAAANDAGEEKLEETVQEEQEGMAVDSVEDLDAKGSLFQTNRDLFFNLKSSGVSEQALEENLVDFRTHNVKKEQSESSEEDNQKKLELWQQYEIATSQMSKELCEQLRLILEPTKASSLKGDYKTGKRLNMKRVVEYIATEYRKDKIWLRRTKPNKRDYQIILAIDNSSSMNDNHCIHIAYEVIATLSSALSLLEVGKLGIFSFGEKVDVIHSFNEEFGSNIGLKVLSKMNFEDEKTLIAQMLDHANSIFQKNEESSASLLANSKSISKLLIILSDGRGVFYEGAEKVKASLQNAVKNGIFVVFLVLDMPSQTSAFKSSIFDIKMPIYEGDSMLPKIVSYMEQFPFPFYVVLKDINHLPTTMTEALKQWFEMVSRSQE